MLLKVSETELLAGTQNENANQFDGQGPRSSARRDSPAGRLYSLDILRFLAAAAVTAYHYAALDRSVIGRDIEWIQPFRFGYLGVDLFFMISGSVISLSIQGRSARSFLVHRAVRLYPTFLLALALAAPIALIFSQVKLSASTIIANATMFAGYLGEPYIDRVYWTLGVEWKFYVLMSVLVMLRLNDRLDIVGTIWSCVLVSIHLGIDLPGMRSAVMFPYGAFFAFGLLAMDTRQSGFSPLRGFGLVLAGIGMAQSATMTFGGFIAGATANDQAISIVLTLLLSALFLAALLAEQHVPARPWFRQLGASTYPLYLLHAGVGTVLIEHWRPSTSLFVSLSLSLAVTGALVVLFTRVVEERMIPKLARSALVRRLAGELQKQEIRS